VIDPAGEIHLSIGGQDGETDSTVANGQSGKEIDVRYVLQTG